MQDIPQQPSHLHSVLMMICSCHKIWEAESCAGLQHDPTNFYTVLRKQHLMMCNGNLHQ